MAATTTSGPVRSASLARVARGDLCSGCGACAALAPNRIDMAFAAPGYLRPQVSAPLTEAEDGAIARVCPGLRQHVTPGPGTRDHPLWGPFADMRVGHATDPDLQFAGASGGGLSALALFLLETGRVEAVIATAADPADPVGNTTVVLRGRADILAAAGSRYAPSSPLSDLPAILAAAPGDRFAFVGKPCDAVALRAMRDRDPVLADRIPVILSFFCAGVPSRTGAEEVLTHLGTDSAATQSFRYRGNGWPGRATATDHTGEERSMSYHDSWGKILSRHVQHRCKICADGTGVAADIACADAWESDANGYPLFEDGEGTSLFVARTPAGQDLLTAAQAAGHVRSDPFDPQELVKIQPGQRERRRALLARLLALRLSGRPVPDYRGLSLGAAARQNPAKRNLQNFLGMLRRTLRRRQSPIGGERT